MKAAPVKIYMTPSFGEPDNVLLASFSKSHLEFHRDIEYVRTDVFIDKACAWLKENKDKYLYNTGKKGEYIPTCSDKIVDDFRKYMEE